MKYEEWYLQSKTMYVPNEISSAKGMGAWILYKNYEEK